jgi:RuvB-like protein 2
MVFGVLFIDEIHLLDFEFLSYLSTVLSKNYSAPIVIMAINRWVSEITSTNYMSPNGLPIDVLDKAFIINTRPNSDNELAKIL